MVSVFTSQRLSGIYFKLRAIDRLFILADRILDFWAEVVLLEYDQLGQSRNVYWLLR